MNDDNVDCRHSRFTTKFEPMHPYFVSFLHLQKYIDDGWEVGRKLKYQILKTESSFKKPLAQQLCKQESLQYNEF